LLVAAVAASCSVATDSGPVTDGSTGTAPTAESSPRGTGAPTSTTTTRVDPPTPAPINYSRPGPYEVGLTTISLGDRSVRVFYPADPAALPMAEPVTAYHPGDAYPPEVGALLATTVPELVADLPLAAYRDVPINDEGPFPIVLQSHGAGGSNLYSSQHLRQQASWGFVVAAPDHLSRNEVASVTNQWGGTPTDVDDLDNTLAALVAANASTDSVLGGGLDTQRVGAEGHSAGAAATYVFAVQEPRVKVWIGQAPVPPIVTSGTLAPFDRPAMVVAGDLDSLVTLPFAQSLYDGLSMPKRMIVVKGAGHATFLDRCQAIFARGGLAQYAEVYPELASLLQGAGDGCSPGNVDPAEAALLINHVMIAQYRIAFGDDRTDVSLDPAYLARTFPVAFGSEQASPPQETVAPVPRPGQVGPPSSSTSTTVAPTTVAP
jgi:predicted dienelactone hydrolase